jgi:hypothetical protein
MRSPRFVLRETEIKPVFAASRLRHTWKTKVRAKMRTHFLPDPIEHLDFHVNLTQNCAQLERRVCRGEYLPEPAHRILMEKSKGLCRQLVIPNVRDALVLQCLSDALYADIKGKAPSKRAFLSLRTIHFPHHASSFLVHHAMGASAPGSIFNRNCSILSKTRITLLSQIFQTIMTTSAMLIYATSLPVKLTCARVYWTC